MIRIECRTQSNWLATVLAALNSDGVCIVEGILAEPLLSEIRPAMYRARDAIQREVGEGKLRAAGELGVLRLMFRFEPLFYRLHSAPVVICSSWVRFGRRGAAVPSPTNAGMRVNCWVGRRRIAKPRPDRWLGRRDDFQVFGRNPFSGPVCSV